MPMGAYDAMLKAGPPQGLMDNPNAMQVGNREGANEWLQRAQRLHSEYAGYRDKYKNAAIIPAHDRARIKALRSHLDHAVNQWQELSARHASELNDSVGITTGLDEAGSIGATLQGAEQIPPPPGTPDDSITNRLQRRASGIQKNPAR